MIDYIVTGTARSGTGFMSHLLSNNGIECYHEGIFGVKNHTLEEYLTGIEESPTVADSSWLVAPFINDIQTIYPHIKIIHVVRNPLKVIRSFLELGFFRVTYKEYKPYQDIINEYINNYSEVEACIDYILEWYSFLENVNKVVVNIDNIDYNKLSEFTGTHFEELEEIVNQKTSAKIQFFSDFQVIKLVKRSPRYGDINRLIEKYGFNNEI